MFSAKLNVDSIDPEILLMRLGEIHRALGEAWLAFNARKPYAEGVALLVDAWSAYQSVMSRPTARPIKDVTDPAREGLLYMIRDVFFQVDAIIAEFTAEIRAASDDAHGTAQRWINAKGLRLMEACGVTLTSLMSSPSVAYHWPQSSSAAN